MRRMPNKSLNFLTTNGFRPLEELLLGNSLSGILSEFLVQIKAIAATLQHTHENIKEAASILGIDRSTLYYRIKKYNLPRN